MPPPTLNYEEPHIQESGGATAISDGRQVQDDGDEFVAVWGSSELSVGDRVLSGGCG